MKTRLPASILLAAAFAAAPAFGQSLDIPAKGFGLSFGNSKNFTGVRFNFRDRTSSGSRGST